MVQMYKARKATMAKIELINKLKARGYNQSRIGEILGFSRQHVSNLVHYDKQLTRFTTRKLIRDDQLTRPLNCSECGEVKELEVHHLDYSKPELIEWLCKSCHQEKTNQLKPPHAPKHGTRSEFVYGCRCQLCKDADNLYKRERWKAKKITS